MINFASLLLQVRLPSTYGWIRTFGVRLLLLLRSISEPAKLMHGQKMISIISKGGGDCLKAKSS